MKYVVYNTDGTIRWEGTCPDGKETLQGNAAKGLLAIAVADNVTQMTHKVNVKTGRANKMTGAEVAARKAPLEALDKMKPGLTKLEKILKHLQKQGVDLGPDAEYLKEETPAG